MVAVCENEVVKRATTFLLNIVMLLATSAYESALLLLGLLMMSLRFCTGTDPFDVCQERGTLDAVYLQQVWRLCQTE